MKVPNCYFDEILNGNCKISCISIKLTQNISKEPLIFSGTGYIYQDKGGALQLELIHICSEKENLSDYEIDHSDILAGEIIPDHKYFSVEAVDTYNNIWNSDELLLSPYLEFFYPTNSVHIKAPLGDIYTVQNITTPLDSKSIHFIVPGKVQIPANRYEKYGKDGRSQRLTLLDIKFNEYDISLNNADDKLIISARYNSYLDEVDAARIIINCFSIILGKKIKPLIIRKSNGYKLLKTIFISNDNGDQGALPPPIPLTPIESSESFSNFVEQFMSCCFENEGNMDTAIHSWRKIISVYGRNLDAESVVIATSIEGIYKKYFMNQPESLVSIKRENKEAIEKISQLSISDFLKEKIKAFVEKLHNKSVKSHMLESVDSYGLSKQMIDVWSKMRNKSAHPGESKSSKKISQNYIKNNYVCISMFYKLIFSIIKYDGYYIDYSIQDWPKRKYGPDNNRA